MSNPRDWEDLASRLDGVYTVEDRGGAVTYGIIDIFMDSQAECTAWGRQKIEIYFMD